MDLVSVEKDKEEDGNWEKDKVYRSEQGLGEA